jgi:large repetitive protein
MAALSSSARAADKRMKHSSHTRSTAKMTAIRKVAVIAVFFVFPAVAGVRSAVASIDNTATANGDYQGTPVSSPDATVNVPVAPAAPAMVVTKIAVPDTNVSAGTLVTYTYTVRNSGNTTLTNVSLNDVHNGQSTPPVPTNELLTADAGTLNDSTDATPNDGVWSVLAPGDEITLTATYTLNQADVDLNQ